MSIEKSEDLFWWRVANIELRNLFSNIFACKLAWRKINIFFITVWKYFLISSNSCKRQRLKETSVYHQHTVGVRGHALLWSGLCVKYGDVYNKYTMPPSCGYNCSTWSCNGHYAPNHVQAAALKMFQNSNFCTLKLTTSIRNITTRSGNNEGMLTHLLFSLQKESNKRYKETVSKCNLLYITTAASKHMKYF